MTDDTMQHPFRDYRELKEAAIEVGVAARDAGVKVALVGGFALQLYGSTRLTGDLDFVASGGPGGFPVDGLLSFGGVKSRAPNGVPVDFILRDDDYAALYAAALSDAMPVDKLSTNLIPIHFIAAMKMASGRTKDMADLEWMVSSDKLDVNLARDAIRKFLGAYAAREFNLFVAEVAWKKQAGLL